MENERAGSGGRIPRYMSLSIAGYLFGVVVFIACSFSSAFVLLSPSQRHAATAIPRYADEVGGVNELPSENDLGEDEIQPSAAWLSDVPIDSNSNQQLKASLRRTLAVDYGTHAVGLAVGIGFAPRMLPGIVRRGSDLDVVRRLLIRAQGEGAHDIVVGFPLFRNGTESDTCKLVRGFAHVLADAGAASRAAVSVFLWDERFTTAQAIAMMDRHGGNMGNRVEVDSLAASLILDDYFTRGGEGAERIEPEEVGPDLLAAAGVSLQGGDKGGGEDDEGDYYYGREQGASSWGELVNRLYEEQ